MARGALFRVSASALSRPSPSTSVSPSLAAEREPSLRSRCSRGCARGGLRRSSRTSRPHHSATSISTPARKTGRRAGKAGRVGARRCLPDDLGFGWSWSSAPCTAAAASRAGPRSRPSNRCHHLYRGHPRTAHALPHSPGCHRHAFCSRLGAVGPVISKRHVFPIGPSQPRLPRAGPSSIS